MSERWVTLLKLDEEARSARLAFLEIDEGTRAALAELYEVLSPHLEAILEEWHGYLLGRAETRGLLQEGRVLSHLRAAQSKYFRTLLAGAHDVEYFEDRLRIGFVHEQVGLEPVWYVGSYRKYLDLVRRVLVRLGHGAEQITRWLSALEKVVYLDVELALEAYFYSKNREVLRANEALGEMTRVLKQRNVELTRLFERAQEAARIKEQFLSKVSHEFRTPVNAIVGFADLMADAIDGPVTEEQARSLRKIRAHGERLLEMVDQMIDAAKMAAAALAEPQPFEVRPVLDRVAAAGREAARSRGLRLTTSIPTDLSWVLGDREGFALSLGQLVENAVKFTASGSIQLAAERVGDTVRFTVTDTGPGVPDRDRERIFEPFYQVEAGDTRHVPGLGMGLTLARRAIERMGGTLALVRTGPGGSMFAIELPSARPGRSG